MGEVDPNLADFIYGNKANHNIHLCAYEGSAEPGYKENSAEHWQILQVVSNAIHDKADVRRVDSQQTAGEHIYPSHHCPLHQGSRPA